MQTRQKSRRNVNVPARYFTGVGEPVDVVLRDISEGGCRFPAVQPNLAVGTPLQISIGGAIPLRAKVRWIEDGEVGVTFDRQIPDEMVKQLKNCQISAADPAASATDFAPMAPPPDFTNAPPRRFC